MDSINNIIVNQLTRTQYSQLLQKCSTFIFCKKEAPLNKRTINAIQKDDPETT